MVNAYILESFHCFVNAKQEIKVDLRKLDEYCGNKGLLGLLFSKLVKDTRLKEKDQNLIKRDLFKLFANVNYLLIYCHEYSFCLSSFLSVIDNTKIDKVEIYGDKWLPSIASSSSYDFICTQYKKANFDLKFEDNNTKVIITKNKN